MTFAAADGVFRYSVPSSVARQCFGFTASGWRFSDDKVLSSGVILTRIGWASAVDKMIVQIAVVF